MDVIDSQVHAKVLRLAEYRRDQIQIGEPDAGLMGWA